MIHIHITSTKNVSNSFSFTVSPVENTSGIFINTLPVINKYMMIQKKEQHTIQQNPTICNTDDLVSIYSIISEIYQLKVEKNRKGTQINWKEDNNKRYTIIGSNCFKWKAVSPLSKCCTEFETSLSKTFDCRFPFLRVRNDVIDNLQNSSLGCCCINSSAGVGDDVIIRRVR